MVVAAVVAWLLVGLGVAVVMVRRGHAPAIWFSLAPFGPLAAALAFGTRGDDTQMVVEPGRAAAAGPGPIDVLVGVDGSPESEAVVAAVPALLGDRLGRLVLATVLDLDTQQLPGQARPRRDAEERLERTADALAPLVGRQVGTVVLGGSPGPALLEHARQGGFGLVAVGRRGRGASRHLVGSVATHLAERTEVPVLLVGS